SAIRRPPIEAVCQPIKVTFDKTTIYEGDTVNVTVGLNQGAPSGYTVAIDYQSLSAFTQTPRYEPVGTGADHVTFALIASSSFTGNTTVTSSGNGVSVTSSALTIQLAPPQ